MNIRAVIRKNSKVCRLMTWDDIELARIYCHPDGDQVMKPDQADLQMSILGIVAGTKSAGDWLPMAEGGWSKEIETVEK
jgi:hypothetical protein